MYTEENDDEMPFGGSAGYGFQAEDWIYWRQSGPPVTQSPVARALGGSTKELFQCPGDKNVNGRQGPYINSYTINSYGTSGGQPMGMASLRVRGRTYVYRLIDVNRPSNKIMYVEEQMHTGAQEAPHRNGWPVSRSVPDDARWYPRPVNQPNGRISAMLTSRHGGRGNCAFADGHVANVDWQFAADIDNSQPNR